MQKYNLGIAALTLFVLFVTGLGFFITGSPFEAKRQKEDEEKVQKMNGIYYAISNYAYTNKSLPQTLEMLKTSSANSYVDMVNPDTNETFEYRIVSNNNFQLCAEFKSDTTAEARPGYLTANSANYHGSGYQCIDYNVTY